MNSRVPPKPPPRRRPASSTNQLGRWTPVIAGAAVLGVVIIAGLSGIGGASGPDSPTTSALAVSATASSVETTVTTLPIQVNSDPAIVKTNLTHTVGKGNVGDEVKKVQQRLTELGFAPGPIDGVFGSGT